jgi:hypothetical protein
MLKLNQTRLWAYIHALVDALNSRHAEVEADAAAAEERVRAFARPRLPLAAGRPPACLRVCSGAGRVAQRGAGACMRPAALR